ncbi:MAG: hypothetical protein ACJ72N_26965 [Labedaea sp.]
MVSEAESTKDTLQVVTESAAEHVGRIATIVTGAVRDIARELGDWLTDVMEMREASERAKDDES